MSVKKLKSLFGLKIQALRRGSGLTQEQLAEKIGRTVNIISSIERGIASTRVETADRLAKALGVSLYELFDLDSRDAKEDRTRQRLLRDFVELLRPHDYETIQTMQRMVKAKLAMRHRKKS